MINLGSHMMWGGAADSTAARMNRWQNMVLPMRRVWLAVGGRNKSTPNGGGLLKLHDDIQTCGYDDIQVMWEILKINQK